MSYNRSSVLLQVSAPCTAPSLFAAYFFGWNSAFRMMGPVELPTRTRSV